MYMKFNDGTTRNVREFCNNKVSSCNTIARNRNNCNAGCHGNCEYKDQYLVGHVDGKYMFPVTRSEFMKAIK